MDAFNRAVFWRLMVGLQVFWLIGCLGPAAVEKMSIEDVTILKVTMTKEVAAVKVNSWVGLTPGLFKQVIPPDTIKAIGAGKDWKIDLVKLNLPARIQSNASGGSKMEIGGLINLTAAWVNKNGTLDKEDFSVFVKAEIINEEGVSRRRLSSVSIER